MVSKPTSRTVAVFDQPFVLPGLDETLPAGEYDIETETGSPADYRHPDAWRASVLIRLHSRDSHPGMARTLTVSLADLDRARAKDKLTGRELSDIFLDDMLADPMVRLVMEADGVSEKQLRKLYLGQGSSIARTGAPAPAAMGHDPREKTIPSAAGTAAGANRTPRDDPGENRAMTDDPVDLDARRSTESRMATDIRRHSLKDFEADQRALGLRQRELEVQLLAEPATTWHEAAIKAQYLIRRYSETAEARDARRQALIERALGDLARLMEQEGTAHE